MTEERQKYVTNKPDFGICAASINTMSNYHLSCFACHRHFVSNINPKKF